MMEYLFVPLWAALETGFAYLLFGSFLEPQCQKEEARYYFVAAWVLNTVYGLFRVEDVYGCLMYLLTAALMLLVIFGEKGPRGLGLLVLALLLSVLPISAFAVGHIHNYTGLFLSSRPTWGL